MAWHAENARSAKEFADAAAKRDLELYKAEQARDKAEKEGAEEHTDGKGKPGEAPIGDKKEEKKEEKTPE
jgi:hypothetical protein